MLPRVLADPAFPDIQFLIADLQAAARTLDLQLVVAYARTDNDLETAFTTLSQQRVAAVLVNSNTFYNRRTEQLATLAARHALPAIFPNHDFALAGGLMSYGTSLGSSYHQVGIWMVIATDFRSLQREHGARTKLFHRLPLGEKGLGRLSVHKLGRFIRLTRKRPTA